DGRGISRWTTRLNRARTSRWTTRLNRARASRWTTGLGGARCRHWRTVGGIGRVGLFPGAPPPIGDLEPLFRLFRPIHSSGPRRPSRVRRKVARAPDAFKPALLLCIMLEYKPRAHPWRTPPATDSTPC